MANFSYWMDDNLSVDHEGKYKDEHACRRSRLYGMTFGELDRGGETIPQREIAETISLRLGRPVSQPSVNAWLNGKTPVPLYAMEGISPGYREKRQELSRRWRGGLAPVVIRRGLEH